MIPDDARRLARANPDGANVEPHPARLDEGEAGDAPGFLPTCEVGLRIKTRSALRPFGALRTVTRVVVDRPLTAVSDDGLFERALSFHGRRQLNRVESLAGYA